MKTYLTNLRTYLVLHKKMVIIGLAIICVLIIILTVLKPTRTPLPAENGDNITPTKSLEIREPSPTPTIPISIHPDSPNFPIVSPLPQTGALEEPLEQSQIDSINQEQALRAKSPLRESKFTVTYDWGIDIFYLELSDPKNDALDAFNQWRVTSFNAIPESRFQLK